MPQVPHSATCSQEAWLLLQPQNADAAPADAAPTGDAAAAARASGLRQRPPLKPAETLGVARKRSRLHADDPSALSPAPGACSAPVLTPAPSAPGPPGLNPAPGANVPRAAPPGMPAAQAPPASAETAATVESPDGRGESSGAPALCAGSVVWAAMGRTAWPALVTRAPHEVSLDEFET